MDLYLVPSHNNKGRGVFMIDYNLFNLKAYIMTCSQADQGCPFIAGASQRIPVQYEDPKVFDQTPQMAEMYEARSRQIASEFYYVFNQLKNS